MAITVTGITPLLEVFDLPASIAFYRDVLGFELISGDDTWWCMLKSGEVRLMLNTAYEKDQRPAVPDGARVRGHGDAELYFDTPDADEVYAQIRSKGWPATEPKDMHYGFRQVNTKDPDGFLLCFISPVESK
jgi:catechol 2,3-dioxygenase-like lactoylglutathione lyase family enzyme